MWRESLCDNYCSDTVCANDTLRLVGGHNAKEGRVQVCENGEWHSICSDNWSVMDGKADVVCSTLGYSAELGQQCLNIMLQEKKKKITFNYLSL